MRHCKPSIVIPSGLAARNLLFRFFQRHSTPQHGALSAASWRSLRVSHQHLAAARQERAPALPRPLPAARGPPYRNCWDGRSLTSITPNVRPPMRIGHHDFRFHFQEAHAVGCIYGDIGNYFHQSTLSRGTYVPFAKLELVARRHRSLHCLPHDFVAQHKVNANPEIPARSYSSLSSSSNGDTSVAGENAASSSSQAFSSSRGE